MPLETVTLNSVTEDTITLYVKGGFLCIWKIADTVDQINEFIKDLPKRDNLNIIYSHEISPSIYESKTYTEYERLECNNINIKVGDLRVNDNLRHKFDKNISFTGEEAFSKRYILALTEWHKDLAYELDYKRDFDKQCSKKFNSIIGVYKSHRIYIASELFRQGYFDKGYTSCTPQDGQISQLLGELANTPQSENESKKNYFYCNNIQKRFDELSPKFQVSDLEIMHKNDGKHIYKSPLNWFSDSYFNIVNETCFSNTWPHNELFITEKTFKPILHQMPFIVAGSAGTLRYLRKQGYQTFPELFDESYDREENSSKRMEMIIEQIQRACDDPDIHQKVYDMQHKLQHNREVLLNV
jgi:hypothetical protein